MMKEFRYLAPEEYARYYIFPPEFEGRASWYIHPAQSSPWDESWLALAFMHPAAHPEMLTLHVCKYDDQYMWAYDQVEDFDVLQHSSGTCILTRERLDEFIALLRKHGEQLADGSQKRLSMFLYIEEK
jgi:hypothetical protein